MTEIDDFINQRVQSNAPGMAVGVAKSGVVLYGQGYGLADLE